MGERPASALYSPAPLADHSPTPQSNQPRGKKGRAQWGNITPSAPTSTATPPPILEQDARTQQQRPKKGKNLTNTTASEDEPLHHNLQQRGSPQNCKTDHFLSFWAAFKESTHLSQRPNFFPPLTPEERAAAYRKYELLHPDRAVAYSHAPTEAEWRPFTDSVLAHVREQLSANLQESFSLKLTIAHHLEWLTLQMPHSPVYWCKIPLCLEHFTSADAVFTHIEQYHRSWLQKQIVENEKHTPWILTTDEQISRYTILQQEQKDWRAILRKHCAEKWVYDCKHNPHFPPSHYPSQLPPASHYTSGQ